MIPPDTSEGGAAAVAEPSTNSTPAAEGGADISTEQLIANTFKTEARPKQSPQRNDPKKADKPAVKPESKVTPGPTSEPKIEAKRPSIFDVDEPKQTPPNPAVDTSEAGEETIKEGDWKAAHAVRNDLRKKISTYEAEKAQLASDLAKYRQVAADPTELQRLKDEHKEFGDRVAIFDFQNHPEFKKQFAEPKQKLLTDAQAILADHGIEGVNLTSLAGMPRAEYAKAMTEIESKLGSFDAGELRILMRDVQKLSVAEKTAVEKRGEIMQGLQQQSQAKMRAAFEEVQKKESMGNIARKWDIPTDADSEERARMEAFNKGVDQVRFNAEKNAFSLGDERNAASIATKAANYDFFREHAFPVMVSEHNKALKQIEALTTKLEALGAHKPGAKFDGSVPKSDANPDENLSVSDLVKRTFRTQ